MSEERVFEFRAQGPSGLVRDAIAASDRGAALRRLQQDGLVVIDLNEARAPALDGQNARRLGVGRRNINDADRIVLLRQIALMLRAGVDLLESLETIANGIGGELAKQLRNVSAALRRGDKLGAAMVQAMPNFPNYVYALVELGQATGQLDKVFQDAAAQMDFEYRIRRDVVTSLTYPLFLMGAGVAAVGFLFYEVVPRFSEMIGASGRPQEGLPGLILGLGTGFRANAPVVFTVLGALVAIAATFAGTKQGRAGLINLAYNTPVLSGLMLAHERATWARVMSFALGNGLGLLEAAELGAISAPNGKFKRNLGQSIRSLRGGKKVDEAFSEVGMLAPIDLSLLRAGQRTGALPAMFAFIAERYEEGLRQAIKRVTALIEPLAIGFVAVAIGAVALGLVSAMSSVYEAVL